MGPTKRARCGLFAIIFALSNCNADDVKESKYTSNNNADVSNSKEESPKNTSPNSKPTFPSNQLKLVEFQFDDNTVDKNGVVYAPIKKPKWTWKINRGITGPTLVRVSMDSPNMANVEPISATQYIPKENLSPGNHTLYLQFFSDEKGWSEIFSQSIYVTDENMDQIVDKITSVVNERRLLHPKAERNYTINWPEDPLFTINCSANIRIDTRNISSGTSTDSKTIDVNIGPCPDVLKKSIQIAAESDISNNTSSPSNTVDLTSGVIDLKIHVTDVYNRKLVLSRLSPYFSTENSRLFEVESIHFVNGQVQFSLPQYVNSRSFDVQAFVPGGQDIKEVCWTTEPSIASCNWQTIYNGKTFSLNIPNAIGEGQEATFYLYRRGANGSIAVDNNGSPAVISRRTILDTLPPSAPRNLMSSSHPNSSNPSKAPVFILSFVGGSDATAVIHRCIVIDGNPPDTATIPESSWLPCTEQDGFTVELLQSNSPAFTPVLKTAIVKAIDASGKSSTAFYPINVDIRVGEVKVKLTDPVSGNSLDYHGGVQNRDVKIQVEKIGNVTEICATANWNCICNWQSIDSPLTYRIPSASGQYTTIITCWRDATGNVAATADSPLFVGPDSPINLKSSTHPDPNKEYNSSEAAFVWTPATVQVLGYQCTHGYTNSENKWVSQTTACNSEISHKLTNLPNGSNYFEVKSKLVDGTYSVPARTYFNVDRKIPKVTDILFHSDLTLNNQQYIAYQKPARISFKSDKHISSICINVDSSSCVWTSVSNSTPDSNNASSFLNSAEFALPDSMGAKTISSAKFKDAVGNVTSVSLQQTLFNESPMPKKLSFDVSLEQMYHNGMATDFSKYPVYSMTIKLAKITAAEMFNILEVGAELSPTGYSKTSTTSVYSSLSVPTLTLTEKTKNQEPANINTLLLLSVKTKDVLGYPHVFRVRSALV